MSEGRGRCRTVLAALLALALPAAPVRAGAVAAPSPARPPAAPSAAQPAPLRIMDADAVPYLDYDGRDDYRRFLYSDLPRAFAVGTNGAHAFASRRFGIAGSKAEALAHCAAAGGTGCALYAVGLDIVWPGAAWHAPTPPATVASADGTALHPDPDYLWHGSDAGMLVWVTAGAHPDEDATPPPYIRLFNNAGLNIVRPDGPLSPALLAAARAGGRRVVLAGDGTGAWAALAAAGHAGAADAVLAVSPTPPRDAHPRDTQPAGFAAMVAALPPSTRLAFVQFDGDDTADGAIQAARAAAAAALRHRLAGLVVLDRPDGFAGHDTGLSLPFARYFGTCMVRLGIGRVPPSGC